MSVTARRGSLLLALTLLLSMLTVLPFSPASAQSVPPETRSASVDGLAHLPAADAGQDGDAASAAAQPGLVRAGTIEAPLPFVSLAIEGEGPAPMLRLRTRDLDGQWSDWIEVAMAEASHAPDPGTPEAARARKPGWLSEMVWAGPSSHVEIEVLGADPDSLEVTFTDTSGLSESVTQRLSRWAKSLTLSGQPAQADAGQPDIVTRKEWGADESLRSGTPTERKVKFGVLHHTATSNDYGPEQGDDIVRSIYRYHTQSNGWSDIGYNFLVDQYGRIYEGRYGGMDKGIQGAHVAGWNSGSFGVSMIGHFNDHRPPTVAMDALKDIFSWKYAVHGLDPDHEATVSHNGYEIRIQESHRNLRDGYVKGSSDTGFQEDCPGRWLYWETPNLRGGTDKHDDGIEDRLDSAFTDVRNSHPFHTEIVWSSAAGIADGYRDGSYRPTYAVSRQGMAAFLHRLVGEPSAKSDPGFRDVDQDHPFYDAIAWAAENDIVEGYDDNTFRPAESVTRQAAAAFFHRLAGEPTTLEDPGFTDVTPAHPFYMAIAWAAEQGLVDGYPDDTFRPGRDVARQAAAAFLHRADDQDVAQAQSIETVDAQADQDAIAVGEDNDITVTVLDQHDEPIEDVTLHFTSDGEGELAPLSTETGPDGQSATTYQAAAEDADTAVTVTVDADGEATDHATFQVDPAEEDTTEDGSGDDGTTDDGSTDDGTTDDGSGDGTTDDGSGDGTTDDETVTSA